MTITILPSIVYVSSRLNVAPEQRLLQAPDGITSALVFRCSWLPAPEARYGELDDIAWYASNSPFSTQPVGQKEPNAWGFLDMLGNVWEWCWDGYDEYPDGPVENPIGADEAIRRVFRGGSWAEDQSFLRVGNRNRADPEVSGNRIGFRVVRSDLP
ncbi:MAG: formylglycine-generating enzyme family protein [Myxococcales bacterium]|nr:formylglycine-generating enzyme family protein [Myxococcales bacterium]